MVSQSVCSLRPVWGTKPRSSGLQPNWSKRDLGQAENRLSIAAIELKAQQYRFDWWRLAHQLPYVATEESEKHNKMMEQMPETASL